MPKPGFGLTSGNGFVTPHLSNSWESSPHFHGDETSETCNISTQPSRRADVRTGGAHCTRLDHSVKAMENPKPLWNNKAGKINLRHLVAVQIQNKMAEPNNKNNVDGHCLWKIEQSSSKSTLPSRLEYQEPPLSQWSPSGFPPQPPEKKGWCQIGTMINFTIPKYHPKQNVCVLDPSSRSTS